MVGKPSRPLLFGGLVAVALVAGAIAFLPRRQAAATPVTVYLTPT